MKTRVARGAFIQLAVASLAFVGGAGAVPAGEMSGGHAVPTKEMREKMATLHEQMATCLRSATAIDECQKEMMKNCEAAMGKGECPMHHHGMMKHPADTAAPAPK